MGAEQEFIFIRLNILREYLERELLMDNLPFNYDFEVIHSFQIFLVYIFIDLFSPRSRDLCSIQIMWTGIICTLDGMDIFYENAV